MLLGQIPKDSQQHYFVYMCFKHVAYKIHLLAVAMKQMMDSGDSKTMLIRANWQALLEYTVDCDELRKLIQIQLGTYCNLI